MARTDTKQGQIVRATKTYFVSAFELEQNEVPSRRYADFTRENRGRLMVQLQQGELYIALTDDGETGMYVRAQVDGKHYACPTLEGTYEAQSEALAEAG